MAKNQTKTYQLSRGQFVGLLLGAVVTSSVATVFGTVRILNADHFTLIALGSRVDAVEEAFVPRGEVTIQLNAIDKRLERIENYIYNK
jgi:hypothetical protein